MSGASNLPPRVDPVIAVPSIAENPPTFESFSPKFDGTVPKQHNKGQTLTNLPSMIDPNKVYTFACVIDGREVFLENKSGKWMKEFANHSRNKRLCTKVCIIEKKNQVDVTAEMKQ